MSIIKANKLEHISTANGGIQLDNAGHVTVDGQQMPTAGALSNRNLVGNGAMIVAQRGTANVTSIGYQTVDRFFTSAAGGTFSQERIDLTSSDSPFSLGFRHAYRVKNSAVATAANNYRQFETRIEAQDVVKSGWNYNSTSSYITVSFWARASVAGTYVFDLRSNDGTAQAYATSITLVANTLKKFELTYPGDSGITIADDNGLGLRLVWGVYFGSNFTDSGAVMDQWHAFSSLNISPDDTAGWGTTLNATFDVTGVQCEVGEKATPFEHRSFGDELARCRRYYFQSKQLGDTYEGCYYAYGISTNRIGAHVRLPIEMRTDPSFVLIRPVDGVQDGAHRYFGVSSGSTGDVSFSSVGFADRGRHGCPYITLNSNSIVQGAGYLFQIEAHAEL